MCWHACPLKGKDLYDVSGAIYKERTVGAVVINNGKFGTPAVCNGCRKCEAGCPYGAPQWNPVSSKVEKCHLCVLTRLKRPDSDGISRPACVDICGGRALQVTDNAAQPYKLVRKMKGRYKGASPDPADGGLTKFVEVVEGIPQSEQRPGEFTKELTVVGEMAPALTKPNFVVRPRCGRYSEIKG
jgi:Fe-S-cluster-containing dehydrogenase component